MVPPKKFISMRFKESLTDSRNAKGKQKLLFVIPLMVHEFGN